MRFLLSQAFLEEQKRFNLHFTCEHCAHFDPRREVCVHGYPITDHVLAILKRIDGELVFCKEFELK